jgi:hypothetical protein
LNYGTKTDKKSEAKVIVATNGGHVAYVSDGGNTVWHSPGVN